MEERYKNILKEVTEGQLTPEQAVSYKSFLSGYFSYLSERRGTLVERFAAEWPTIREQSKSVAEAEKKWAVSSNGVEDRKLKFRTESVEKLISALNSTVYIAKAEAQNLH